MLNLYTALERMYRALQILTGHGISFKVHEVGQRFRYRSFKSEPEREAEGLADRLAKMVRVKTQGERLMAPDIKGLGWTALRPSYSAVDQ